MRALIFGAGGQIGVALRSSSPPGVEIVPITRDRCDLADSDAVSAIIRSEMPDIVINAAAYTDVDGAEAEPDRARLVNAEAPAVMARVARGIGARMTHLSTDFVFGGTAKRPRKPSDKTDPQSVYGRTKRDGEIGVLAADPNALVVRTAWVYGSGRRDFVGKILAQLANQSEVRVVADQIGTPTWAASLSVALWRLAPTASGVFHYTDAGRASRYDFAIGIAEEARAAGVLRHDIRLVPISAEDYFARAARPTYSVLDCTATWAKVPRPRPWRDNLRAYFLNAGSSTMPRPSAGGDP